MVSLSEFDFSYTQSGSAESNRGDRRNSIASFSSGLQVPVGMISVPACRFY
jgi:hypothetical protein